MSMKRILGVMLASRMAGRGQRGGGLGSAAMLGGLGARGMRGKLGLAALGYMAYRAWQDRQSAGTPGRGATTGGGLGGLVRSVADRVTGAADGGEDEEGARAADRLSDDKALLLLRAMIAAAFSDGSLSEAERARIMAEIDEAGADAGERHAMEREIANPRSLDALLAEVRDPETAQEFYLASRAAIDPDTDRHRTYLADLRRRLGLSDEDAAEVDRMIG